VNAGLGTALRMVESGHRAAPAQALTIAEEMGKWARTQTAAWQRFKTVELSGVNAALARANRKALQIAAIEEQVHYAMTR
jgi:ATP:corrinoid adenosyltransferase